MNKKLIIVKIGGKVTANEAELEKALFAFSKIEGKKILVHGGGKKASEVAEMLNIDSKFIDGRRITDKPMLEIAVMVYAGLVNKSIVAKLQSLGCNALGVCGADLNLIKAEKRTNTEFDFGLVGDITKVNSKAINSILEAEQTLIVSSITQDGNGQLLNTNADAIAAKLSEAMADNYDVSLIYCFEHKGVFTDIHDPNTLIENLSKLDFDSLKNSGKIKDGMIPKLSSGFSAIKNKVKSVIIGNTDYLINNNNPKTTLIN